LFDKHEEVQQKWLSERKKILLLLSYYYNNSDEVKAAWKKVDNSIKLFLTSEF